MNNKYRYPVYSVTSCPTNATKWETAARRRNCSFDEVKPINHYMCVPNQEKTEFLEFCYDQIRPMVQTGTCLELAGTGTLNQVKCKTFRNGCPEQPYLSDSIYQHPACLDVNTEDRCFYEDPACPNRMTTVERTDLDGAGSSWVAGAVIGSLVLVAIIIMVVLFRRRIMAFFQSTEKDNRSELEISLMPKDVEGNISIPKYLFEAEKEKALDSKYRTCK